MDEMNLCQGCKTIREITWTDEADRQFCAECAVIPSSQDMALLAFLAATVPFKEGDEVDCWTGGQVFDGTGHVVEVSFDPKDLASPVVPMFRVAIDEPAYEQVPDEIWYSEVCLKARQAAKN
jgi:hypothetical protein